MARMTGAFKCPGCQFDTRVGYEHPGVVGASVFTFACGTCKSTVQIRAKRAKNEFRHGIQYDAKVTRVSPALALLAAEEQAHHAKPLEQLDAESAR